MLSAKQLLKSPLLKSTMIYTMGDSIGKAIPFILLPIVAKYLSPADFGVFTNFGVAVQIFTAICALNTYSMLSVSYYSIDPGGLRDYLSNLIYLIVALGAFTCLMILLFDGFVERYLGISAMWQYLAVLSSVAASIFMLYTSLLRMQNRIYLFNAVQILQSLVTAVLAIAFVVVLRWSWQGRAISMVAAAVVSMMLSLWLMGRSRYLFGKVDAGEIKRAFHFGLPLLPHTLSFWFKSGMDKIIISNCVNIAANGVYSVAFNLGGIIGVFTGSFFNAYAPLMYKDLSLVDTLPEDEAMVIKKKLVKITYLFAALLLGMCVGSYFIMVFIIPLFFSGDYLGAIQYMPLLMTTLYFQGMYSMVSGYIFYRKKTKILGTITFLSSMLQICLTYLFVRSFGSLGAVYSSSLVSLITFLAVLFYADSLYRLPWNFRARSVVAIV
ncbi:lipopolysaccharide biosynthesis protein [Geomesophilobacter sediminis]|uniref:Oligosaccharide flippase family protein n=1 Tax=Geomesophilobacter sediminis TaxID=2798584 RepID=A0A8J7IYY4_9BACT|nr:oligosaccharide flippase family protein [Geomesophilobacter sediminis]MBJ6723163.1 oligosaccharide flippase family protein [Geomesophilobacter sediminis]